MLVPVEKEIKDYPQSAVHSPKMEVCNLCSQVVKDIALRK